MRRHLRSTISRDELTREGSLAEGSGYKNSDKAGGFKMAHRGTGVPRLR